MDKMATSLTPDGKLPIFGPGEVGSPPNLVIVIPEIPLYTMYGGLDPKIIKQYLQY